MNTYFLDEDERQLGSEIGVIPISLFKGMTITIHGYGGKYEVRDWNYHHGHTDEMGGLRIILRKKGEFAGGGFGG